MAVVISLGLIRGLPLLMMICVVSSQNGVSIRFMGNELTNGTGRVCARDIGEQPSLSPAMEGVPDRVEGPALVCVTTNPNCCRGVDNSNGGAVGEWIIDGVQVVGTSAVPLAPVYRNRGTGLVRLNARPGLGVFGEYCCQIPDISDVLQTLCVDGTFDDADCNPPTTDQPPATSQPQPPATTSSDGEMTEATRITDSTTQANNATPASTIESPATFILAGVVAILSLVNVLLIGLVMLLFYKYKRAKYSHDITEAQSVQVVATDIDLNENQAYGKVREAQQSSNEAMPDTEQTTDMYEYIPNTLPQGHPPAAQTSAVDNGEGTVSSEVYQEIS